MQCMSETAVDIAPVPPLAGALPPQCQKDLDILRKFVRDSIDRGRPADPVSPAEFREVLLTGATGFIGRFFLYELLRQNTGLTVRCLVRADSAAHGRERIHAAMRQAEIWDEDFDARIEVTVGDIVHPGFGLAPGQFDALCRRIDAVYHLAADINIPVVLPGHPQDQHVRRSQRARTLPARALQASVLRVHHGRISAIFLRLRQ